MRNLKRQKQNIYFPFDNKRDFLLERKSPQCGLSDSTVMKLVSTARCLWDLAQKKMFLFFLHSFRLLFSSTAFWRLSFWNHTQPVVQSHCPGNKVAYRRLCHGNMGLALVSVRWTQFDILSWTILPSASALPLSACRFSIIGPVWTHHCADCMHTWVCQNILST